MLTKSAFFLFLIGTVLFAEPVTVTVNHDKTLLTSQFKIGTTHTHGFWEYGNNQAVNRVRDLLIEGIAFQNQHIMGWGVGNPEPEPGNYKWNDLDHRVELMRDIGTPMSITFCQAPGWMKGTDDWDMEQEVLDEYVSDFADLCQRVAERYPDVNYFQVWNELKGYWSSSLNNWDYQRYTEMYNAVYEAVKSVRPDALIGGPYIVIQGDGAVEIGKTGRDTFVPLGGRDRTFLEYWLENKTSADFICMDYGLIDYHDPNNYTHDEQMQLTRFLGKWIRDIRAMTDLPIVISEFYGGADASDPDFTAANHASCYLQALIDGASLALQWNPEQGELDNYLFTDTEASDGGQPAPHYHVVKAINDYFSEGTEILETTSSSEWIEVVASDQKTMLINKKDEPVSVQVNGTLIELDRYKVRVIDTPEESDVKMNNQNDNTSQLEIQQTETGTSLRLTPSRSTNINVSLYNVLGQQISAFDQPVTRQTVSTIRPFKNVACASGVYIVRIKGLERPLVQTIRFSKNQ